MNVNIYKKNIPNILSWSRIPALLLLTIAIWYQWNISSLILSLYAAYSDWADGYYARKWSVNSSFGASLDATIDKLILFPIIALVLRCDFLFTGLLVLIAIMALREIHIIMLRKRRGYKTKSILSAKLKTAFQFGIIVLYPVAHMCTHGLKIVIIICVYICFVVSTLLSVYSAWSYTFRPIRV